MIILKIITIAFLFFYNFFLFSQIMVFENFNEISNREWEFISDQVMGGISTGSFSFLKEKEKNFIRLIGSVSTENNGGFIQARKKIRKKIEQKPKIIKIIARGNHNDYFLHLRTSYTILPWQFYQIKFSVTNQWQTFTFNLKDFKGSGKLLPRKINFENVKSLALVAIGRNHFVELDVSSIVFEN